MATSYKLNGLAKDLNMRTKDLSEILVSGGFAPKSSSQSLNEEEFSYLMDRLSKDNQTSDLNGYLAGTTYIRVETDEKREKRLAAEKAAAEKAAAEKAAAEKAAAEKAAAEKAAAEKAAAEKAAAEKAARLKEKEQKDRFSKPVTFEKAPAKKDKESDKKKQDKKPEVTVPRKNVQDDKPAVASTIFGHKSGTRVIDTRTTSVDLDKYDERLDMYSADIPYEAQKQKLKKGGNRPQQGGGKKNEPSGYKSGNRGKDKKGQQQNSLLQNSSSALPFPTRSLSVIWHRS